MATRLYQTFVLPEQAAAATPAANSVAFYAKSDGRLYGKDDAGVEFAAGMPAQIAGSVDVLAGLVTQGLRAASANPPLNLGTGVLTTGQGVFDDGIGRVITGSNNNVGLISGRATASGVSVWSLLDAGGLWISSSSGIQLRPTNTTTLTLTTTLLTFADAVNVALNATSGTKWGTSTSDKQAWWNATPVVQPAGTTDVLGSLVTLGLRAASSNPPLNLGTGTLTAGQLVGGATGTSAVYLSASANKSINFFWSGAHSMYIGTATRGSSGDSLQFSGDNMGVMIDLQDLSPGRLAFFGATPVVQIAGSTDVLAGLVSLGLRAASSNPPLNLGSGAITAGAGTFSDNLVSTGNYSSFSKTTVGVGTVQTAGTTALVGTSTRFTDSFAVGDTITVSGETVRTIATITDNTHLTVTVAFSTTASGLTYTQVASTPWYVSAAGSAYLTSSAASAAVLTIDGGTSHSDQYLKMKIYGSGPDAAYGLIYANYGLDLGTTATPNLIRMTGSSIGFFTATPVTQQAGATDVLASLVNLGLRAASSNPPLNIGTGTFTGGILSLSQANIDTNGTLFVLNGSANANGINFAGGQAILFGSTAQNPTWNFPGRTGMTTTFDTVRMSGIASQTGYILRVSNSGGTVLLGVTGDDKLGFYGASAVAQISGSTDVLAGLVTLGLRAASSNPPLNLGTGALTAGISTFTDAIINAAVTPKLALQVATVERAYLQTNNAGDTRLDSDGSLVLATNNTPALSFTSAGVSTHAALLITVASATGSSGFRLPHGAAPTAPTDGDVWTTTAGLYARINGSTVGPFAGAGGFASLTADNTWSDGVDFALGSTAGTMFGTANTQKLAFWGATPVTQIAGSTDVLAGLVTVGLRAASSNPPLNLGSGMLTAGSWTTSNSLISAAAGLLGSSGYMQFRSSASGSTGIVITPNSGGASELALYSTDYQGSQVNTEYLDIAALSAAEYVISTGATGTGTRRGLKFDTLRLGFFNTTPAAQIAGSTDVLAGLVTLGLRAASSNPPLDLGTGAVTAGAIAGSGAFSVTGGNFQVRSTGALGIGAAASNTYMINLQATHPGTVASIYGFAASYTIPSTATTAVYAHYSKATTAAAAFTLVTHYGFYADTPVIGAGPGAITNNIGYAANNLGATNVANAFGIDIAAQSGATTINTAARLSGGTTANLHLNSNTASELGGIGFGTTIDTSLSRNAAGILQIGGAAGAGSAIIVTDIASADGQVARHRSGAAAGLEWSDSIHGSTHMYVVKNPGAATVTAVGTPAPTLTATATTADGTDGAWLNSATTAVSGNASGIISTFTLCQTSWLPEIEFRIKTGASITAFRLWIGLFSASPDASDTPAIHMAAFRYSPAVDGTAFWRLVTDNASGAPNVVTSTIAIAASTVYVLRIVFRQSDGMALFYINGVLAGGSVTKLPTTTQLLGYGVRVTTNTNGAKGINTGRISLSYV